MKKLAHIGLTLTIILSLVCTTGVYGTDETELNKSDDTYTSATSDFNSTNDDPENKIKETLTDIYNLSDGNKIFSFSITSSYQNTLKYPQKLELATFNNKSLVFGDDAKLSANVVTSIILYACKHGDPLLINFKSQNQNYFYSLNQDNGKWSNHTVDSLKEFEKKDNNEVIYYECADNATDKFNNQINEENSNLSKELCNDDESTEHVKHNYNLVLVLKDDKERKTQLASQNNTKQRKQRASPQAQPNGNDSVKLKPTDTTKSQPASPQAQPNGNDSVKLKQTDTTKSQPASPQAQPNGNDSVKLKPTDTTKSQPASPQAQPNGNDSVKLKPTDTTKSQPASPQAQPNGNDSVKLKQTDTTKSQPASTSTKNKSNLYTGETKKEVVKMYPNKSHFSDLLNPETSNKDGKPIKFSFHSGFLSDKKKEMAEALSVTKIMFYDEVLAFGDKLPNYKTWEDLTAFLCEHKHLVMLRIDVKKANTTFHYYYALDKNSNKFKNTKISSLDEQAETDSNGLIRYPAPKGQDHSKPEAYSAHISSAWPSLFDPICQKHQSKTNSDHPNLNITIIVPKKENCLARLFKLLLSCFGKNNS